MNGSSPGYAVLAETNASGQPAVGANNDNASGFGVYGQADGADAIGTVARSDTGTGLKGWTQSGTAVLALAESGGVGLDVQGPAMFSRSGRATVGAGKASVKVSGQTIAPARWCSRSCNNSVRACGSPPRCRPQPLTRSRSTSTSRSERRRKSPGSSWVEWDTVRPMKNPWGPFPADDFDAYERRQRLNARLLAVVLAWLASASMFIDETVPVRDGIIALVLGAILGLVSRPRSNNRRPGSPRSDDLDEMATCSPPDCESVSLRSLLASH